jgi:hypothetical protein
MSSVRALLLADSPPDGAATIVDNIHLVSFDKAMAEGRFDPAGLRLFIGYAGWAPGQLDGELAIRSWEVVPASAELVFADDPGGIWQSLAPVLEYRAAIDQNERLHKAHHLIDVQESRDRNGLPAYFELKGSSRPAGIMESASDVRLVYWRWAQTAALHSQIGYERSRYGKVQAINRGAGTGVGGGCVVHACAATGVGDSLQ